MLWDHETKKTLHSKLKEKLLSLEQGPWLAEWEAKRKNKPKANTSRWNSFIDGLGCTRIIRSKRGWDYEDEKTPRSYEKKDSKTSWKSINAPGYVHVSNPIWPGSFGQSEHIIRIPKETAEKIMVLGLP